MNFNHVIEMPHVAKCNNLDSKSFLEKFGKPNIPFVLEGGMNNSPAMETLTWNFFREKYGTRNIIVYRSNNRNDYKTMLFKDYIDYVFSTHDEDPYYLLDWFVEFNCPEVLKEYTVPSYFKSWADKLPDALRYKFLSFYLGPKNSSSPLHVDIMATSAWNAVFKGQKLWVFYPQSQTRFIYNGKVNPFKPDYDRYPLFKEARGFYCIQNPGDIVFTPSRWWHAVYNTETVISLTDNFVNNSNIKIFIKEFIPASIHVMKRTWLRRKQKYNR